MVLKLDICPHHSDLKRQKKSVWPMIRVHILYTDPLSLQVFNSLPLLMTQEAFVDGVD